MNNPSQLLLPVFATSFLLSSIATPVIAEDVTRPAITAPVVVRFTPVPYRRTIQTDARVRVASFTKEVATLRQPEVTHIDHQVVETFDLVKTALLQRVEDYKANQPIDVLVPAPRDLEPGSNLMFAATRVTSTPKSQPYTPRTVIQNREPVRFHSAAAVRSVY